MKRFSEMAAAVTAATQPPAAPAPAEDHGRFCAARGCPLPGTIRGGREWFCGHHRGALPVEWPRITADIIAEQQAGTLDPAGAPTKRRGPTPAVAAMLAKVRPRRQPGDDT